MLATVKDALITSLHQRFDVNIAGGENMEVQGTIVEHEEETNEGRHRVAETDEVDTFPGADDMLLLSVKMVIDLMVDPGRLQRHSSSGVA